MKFAKYLAENQIAEWKSMYIDYKMLKKALKSLAQSSSEQSQELSVKIEAEAAEISAEINLVGDRQNNFKCFDFMRSILSKDFPNGAEDKSENMELAQAVNSTESVYAELSCSDPVEVVQVIDVKEEDMDEQKENVDIERGTADSDPTESKGKHSPQKNVFAENEGLKSNKLCLKLFRGIYFFDMVPKNVQNHYLESKFMRLVHSELEKVFSFFLKTENSLFKQIYVTLQALNFLTKKSDIHRIPFSFKKSKKETRRICMELHLALRMIKNYLSINIVALSKILKKHDKLSKWTDASRAVFQYEHLFLNSKTIDEQLKILERSYAEYERRAIWEKQR
jgi:SPX domain protein involved in polyphosphate accumulation